MKTYVTLTAINENNNNERIYFNEILYGVLNTEIDIDNFLDDVKRKYRYSLMDIAILYSKEIL